MRRLLSWLPLVNHMGRAALPDVLQAVEEVRYRLGRQGRIAAPLGNV
jgi:hypothetical protein